MQKNTLFIDFWNCSPHLETSLELVKNELDNGSKVTFLFLGHAAPFQEGISISKNDINFLTKLPENRGISLIKSKNLYFNSLKFLPKIDYEPFYIDNIQQLMELKYKGADLGVGIASSLISLERNSEPSINQNKKQIELMIDSAIRVFEFSKKAIQDLEPDLIYIFNGRFCNQRAAMCAALDSNTPILFHERGCSQDHYDLIPNMFHDQNRVKDRILSVWDREKSKSAYEIGSQYFIDKRSGYIKQGKSFTSFHKKGELPFIEQDKKVVTFFSSSDYEFAAVGDMFKWEGWNDQFEAVLDLISICSMSDHLQLIIRLHPNLNDVSESDKSKWNSLSNYPDITLISFLDTVDSYALVEASDIVINAGSTIGIEAVFWGKPSITLGPAFYPLMGATYGAKNRDELESLLITGSSELIINKEGAVAFGYFVNTFGIPFKYYRATSFTSGEFLGNNLQKKSKTFIIWGILKDIIKRRINKLKNLITA